MTGYIKITATTRNDCQGLEVMTDIQDVSIMDRMQLLNSLCRSLRVSPSELKLFMSLKSLGILDKASTVATIQDEHVRGPGADLYDQLLSFMLEGDNNEG